MAAPPMPNGAETVVVAADPHRGARLGYRDLWQAGYIAPPQDETFAPTSVPAYAGPLELLEVVVDDSGVVDPTEVPPISLLRQENATEAYAILPSRSPIRLDHHHPNWGVVMFAMVYPCVGPNKFKCPTSVKEQKHVAIKVLSKQVVHKVLSQNTPGVDNPYKEVARMRELNDPTYVLSCIDFMEDEEFLYIVTPKGEKTLKDVITWGKPDRTMSTQQAIGIFSKILKIVNFLQSRGINHHDLSPDNLLLMPNGDVVVFDLAKSVRMPMNSANGNRGLMHHPSAFGTMAWMCPEVFRQLPYDGCSMDLWAAGLIFYNLLTNLYLYESPRVTDHRFRLFVLAEGLQDVDANELAIEVVQGLMSELGGTDDGRRLLRCISQMADTHLRLAPELRCLLAAMLNADPAQRPTLAQVMESGLLHGGVGG